MRRAVDRRTAEAAVKGALCAAVVGIVAAGCATTPTSPRVLVLPGAKKSLAQFQGDDTACRRWAGQQLDAAVNEPASAAATKADTEPATAPPLAAFGAAAVVQRDHWSSQDRYDVAYLQCMYASGNRVPIPRGFVTADPTTAARPPGLPAMIPPPPEGIPPPPPPGAVR